ncbi:MAG: serine/threonine protein kinase [Planctomycetes bacterium]|nr:serine/threonine protein kinase [Planctomycetota bacterium]
MQPTDSALRAALLEAARSGQLDAELARRAGAALERAPPGAGAAALLAAGVPPLWIEWLMARAAAVGGQAVGAPPRGPAVAGPTANDEPSTEVVEPSARRGPGETVTGTPGSASSALAASIFLRRVPPGTRIGPFTVEGELGRGGMGVVLRARDDAGRPVALKLVLAQRDTSLKRFAREVEALAGLAHDNVVRYLGSGDEPMPWLAMELVEGEDLKARLQRERQLSAPAAARLMEGVARGVAHAHARGIVHRDLKPSNVLVRPGGQAVVTDFGLARSLDASRFTQTGALLGTLATMAPEQVRGERVGPPADVWALGVMLFACLTGRSPFNDDSAIALTTAIVHQELPTPRSIDPRVPLDLDATCRACLQRDPGLRPTAQAVARALRERRPPAGAPTAAAGRGRGPLLGGLAAVALAVAAERGGGVGTEGAGAAPVVDAPPEATAPPSGPPAEGQGAGAGLGARRRCAAPRRRAAALGRARADGGAPRRGPRPPETRGGA